MQFNDHRRLAGAHSFLSASKYHWINYDEEKMIRTYSTSVKAQLGSQLHDFASMAIKLKVRQRNSNKTLCAYVNDAIGFRMTPEQPLFYSEFAFGTADAIGFRDNYLRIFDLKTGVGRTSFHQLEIYAAYFCLEYDFKPGEIKMEFRIYQNDGMEMMMGDPIQIAMIMDKIVTFDKRIRIMRQEAGLD